MSKHHKEKEERTGQTDAKGVNTLEEELQQKYIQLQVMKQQAQSFFEEKQKLDNHLSEMSLTLDAIKKLTSVQAAQAPFAWMPFVTQGITAVAIENIKGDIKSVDKKDNIDNTGEFTFFGMAKKIFKKK